MQSLELCTVCIFRTSVLRHLNSLNSYNSFGKFICRRIGLRLTVRRKGDSMKEISLKNRSPFTGGDLSSLENGSNNINHQVTQNGIHNNANENSLKKVQSQGLLTLSILLIMWCVLTAFHDVFATYLCITENILQSLQASGSSKGFKFGFRPFGLLRLCQ